MTQRDSQLGASLDAAALAALSGTSVSRIAILTDCGLLAPPTDDHYSSGDVHRIRAIDAFEAAGIPLDALAEAQRAGTISLAYYDQLHADPGTLSPRTYAEFAESLGPRAAMLPAVFRAHGLAEPAPKSRLSTEDESMIATFLRLAAETGQPDLGLRVGRVFAEAIRRAAEASLDIYAEALSRAGTDLQGLPPEEQFEVLLSPWAELGLEAPRMAAWLTRRHLSAAIDAYSVTATEDVLRASGYVPKRTERPPAVAFVDLTGFTRLSVERGDEAAAALALRFGELASATIGSSGGRMVKLLGDGVLLRFMDPAGAVTGTLALLDALAAHDLPPGHAGIHAGPVIARDGDIFGRTVNLAARISDQAEAGELLVSGDVVEWLEDADAVQAIGSRPLQGVGDVPLFRVHGS